MVDVVTAVSSVPLEQVQAWNTPEIADPESVDRFEQALNVQGDRISPLEGENIVKPPGLADRILENIISIDSAYQRLFPEGIDRMPRASVTLDPLTRSGKDQLSSSGIDLAASFELMEDAHAWHLDVLSWNMRWKLLTTTVTTGANGTSTLLKSGGG